MCVFYCLVVSNKDNFCTSLIYAECPQKDSDIIKVCYVAIYLFLMHFIEIMVAVQALKGKSIYSSHMHVENVPEWVNRSARDRK